MKDNWSQDSVVDIVTKIRAGRCGVRIPAMGRDLPLLQDVQTVTATHPAPYSVGSGGRFLGCKITWHDANLSPSSAEFNLLKPTVNFTCQNV
jgi:hypothetical protein